MRSNPSQATSKIPLLSFILATALLWCVPLPVDAEIGITECGQSVANNTAVLSSDLDCSTYPGIALHLNASTLQMNGFRIIGNPDNEDPEYPALGLAAVQCDFSCRLIGPGTITGAGGGSLNGDALSLDGAAVSGGNVYASDVTLEGNGGTAIAAGRLRLESCTIRQNAGNGIMFARRLRAVGTIVEQNGIRGVVSLNAKSKAILEASSVLSHQGDGILVNGSIKVRESTATNNGLDSNKCLTSVVSETACVDIVAGQLRLRDSTCGSSYDIATSMPTGFCTDD